MPRTFVVIPCFNEAQRLQESYFAELLGSEGLEVVAVDDGSRDDTRSVLESFRERLGPRVHVLGLEKNSGKAEAIRQGTLRSIELGAAQVGYLDADGSTPAREFMGMLGALNTAGREVVLASRFRRLGSDIERSAVRHYVGRIFATAASISLRLPVYDTQCGAKVFVVGPAVREAFARPFASRWAFDVELIARLLDAGLPEAALYEFALSEWRHRPGTKLTGTAAMGAFMDLVPIARRRWGRRR